MIEFSRQSKTEALSGLLVLVGLCILGMVVFSAVGIFLASVFTDLDISELQSLAFNYKNLPQGRMSLLLMQGVISLGSFVFFPWMIRFFKKEIQGSVSSQTLPNATLLILIFALSILMLPVNGWLAALNESFYFPSFLSDLKDWATKKENEMEGLTLFLIDFQSGAELIIGFIVISLIAGFSEEFFFRKMLQPRIYVLTGNIHVAIWLTAFLFSAIHFQFFGLIPRMVLGALFGYYFWWTGNIWISVLGHSLNNGITLAGMYLYSKNLSPVNVEDPKIVPAYLGAIATGVVWSLAIMLRDEAVKIRKKLPVPEFESVSSDVSNPA